MKKGLLVIVLYISAAENEKDISEETKIFIVYPYESLG